ncbi:UNVERIFIED_CONTAM: hypothetical protein FKN15_066605 [Acipenser sinensis]
MKPLTWTFFAIFYLSAWVECRKLHLQTSGASPHRRNPRSTDEEESNKKCSYTFLIPQQKITGPICANAKGPVPDKERVTRMELEDLKEILSKQKREIETLQLVVDVDGNIVNEMKLLRKESRNMNSRVTQLYMQLLHEIIRKRDNSLEISQLENKILNVTSEMLKMGSRYKELQQRYAELAGLVNNQSVIITMLEEQCMRTYTRKDLPAMPPLVQVVPEHIPPNNRYSSNLYGSNEIQRDQNQAYSRDRGIRMDPSPTSVALGIPPAQGTAISDGSYESHSPIKHITVCVFLSVYTPQQPTKGFGNIDNEYWLGLENIYNLAKQGSYRLLIELEDWTDKKVYAEYSSFHLEPESDFYRLRLGTYQGNAGDSLMWHNGKQFTTLDRDKDAFSGNCAHFHKGGWWYNSCAQSNLNGVWYRGGHYRSKFQDGIYWAEYRGGSYSLREVQMMLRPID